MKEMTMLDLDRVDLGELCMALEDHSSYGGWLLDPRTGETYPAPEGELDDWEFEVDQDALVPIEPIPPSESYGDMADFAARVRDPRARDLLQRAIEGRGAFRRFKDTLFEFPELRETWFAFHDARTQRRAIDWLEAEGLIDQDAAERARAERREPDAPELLGFLDGEEIAQAVAADLRQLYGERLRGVLLFGSWARGEAHAESDIDLLVVLDRVGSRREERVRMEDVVWPRSLEYGTHISLIPVSEEDFSSEAAPLYARARAEGIEVG
jgi:predicted nucleotidyltransferase